MRGNIYTTFGEPADVLIVSDSAIPQPGPGQVRIRTILSPIHNHDLWTVRGSYGYKPELPAIGGSEAVGTIDALGDDVDGWQMGDEVVALLAGGGYAEQVIVPAGQLLHMPDGVEPAVASTLVEVAATVISNMDHVHLHEGETILVHGGAGGIGRGRGADHPVGVLVQGCPHVRDVLVAAAG